MNLDYFTARRALLQYLQQSPQDTVRVEDQDVNLAHALTTCFTGGMPERVAYADPERTGDDDPLDEVVGTGPYHLEMLSEQQAYLRLGNQHLHVYVDDAGHLQVVRRETLEP